VEREELALAGKWCTSLRILNRERRICLIGRGQKRRSRRHRGVTSPLAAGETETESQKSQELIETPPINSSWELTETPPINFMGVNRNSSNQFHQREIE
jgi:hypothetical protein